MSTFNLTCYLRSDQVEILQLLSANVALGHVESYPQTASRQDTLEFLWQSFLSCVCHSFAIWAVLSNAQKASLLLATVSRTFHLSWGLRMPA
eukprot:996902-Pelagomonas_calceolata.AAC.4